MSYSCKICFNSDDNKTYVAREMMFGLRDEFLYFECSKCKCLQIAEFPENIAKYYLPENYYSFKQLKKNSFKGFTGFLKRKIIRSNVLSRDSVSNRVVHFLVPEKKVNYLNGIVKNPDARILDVGCGNGQKLLYPLFQSGFRNVEGCDPFIEHEINDPNGFKIQKKEIFELNGEWDIICFNHSFEHIDNPLETLQRSKKLLKKEGFCIIRIPTSSSFAWKNYRTNWFQLDAPRHFFLHSVESMQYLADKADLELVSCAFDSTHHQFTISERYKQDKSISERTYKTKFGKLVNMIMKLRYAYKAKKLNREKRGDQAIFYMQKK